GGPATHRKGNKEARRGGDQEKTLADRRLFSWSPPLLVSLSSSPCPLVFNAPVCRPWIEPQPSSGNRAPGRMRQERRKAAGARVQRRASPHSVRRRETDCPSNRRERRHANSQRREEAQPCLRFLARIGHLCALATLRDLYLLLSLSPPLLVS